MAKRPTVTLLQMGQNTEEHPLQRLLDGGRDEANKLPFHEWNHALRMRIITCILNIQKTELTHLKDQIQLL